MSRFLLLFVLLAAPLAADAEKYELRYKPSTGAAVSVFVEINRTETSPVSPQDEVCALARTYVARASVQAVRVWELTPDSTRQAMTRNGGPIYRVVEDGVVE